MDIEKMLNNFEERFKKIVKVENVKVEIKKEVKQEVIKEIKQVDKNNFDLSTPIKPIINVVADKIKTIIEREYNNIVVVEPITQAQEPITPIVLNVANTPIQNKQVENVIITFNNEKNGIELSFTTKPNQETLTQLKSHGFFWHNVKKIWYSKQSEAKINFAYSLITDIDPVVQDKLKLENENEIINIIEAKVPLNNSYLSNNTTPQRKPHKEEIQPINIIDVSENEIFIHALVPAINKNDNINLNDKEIEIKSTLTKFKITDMVILSNTDYHYFINNLLSDYEFLKGKGGSECEELPNNKYNFLYDYCVAVMCENEDIIIIDPQGSSYAKYTCRLVEEVEKSVSDLVAS